MNIEIKYILRTDDDNRKWVSQNTNVKLDKNLRNLYIKLLDEEKRLLSLSYLLNDALHLDTEEEAIELIEKN